ncbi:MAG: hypothetical protein WCJ64_22255 [Rhodospirillaceae bacterium]
MARKSSPVPGNPVVLHPDRTVPPGWVKRAVGDEALHRPFPSRPEAVDYALRAQANPAGARTLAPLGRGRRAAWGRREHVLTRDRHSPVDRHEPARHYPPRPRR